MQGICSSARLPLNSESLSFLPWEAVILQASSDQPYQLGRCTWQRMHLTSRGLDIVTSTGLGFVPVALQAYGILWCVTAKLSSRRKEPSVHLCKLEKVIFIAKAAPRHVIWARGANICTHSKLLLDQGMGQKGTMDHPSTPKAKRNGPCHSNSKRMWLSLRRW